MTILVAFLLAQFRNFFLISLHTVPQPQLKEQHFCFFINLVEQNPLPLCQTFFSKTEKSIIYLEKDAGVGLKLCCSRPSNNGQLLLETVLPSFVGNGPAERTPKSATDNSVSI